MPHFVIFNRHCFNGVTRYNQNGEFNGYGANTKRPTRHAEMEAFWLMTYQKTLPFASGDFASVIERLVKTMIL
nr:DNA adenine methylase [Salmonella sp.]